MQCQLSLGVENLQSNWIEYYKAPEKYYKYPEKYLKESWFLLLYNALNLGIFSLL